MICRTCGRMILNEKANFCEYCGTAVDERREGAQGSLDGFARQESNGREEGNYREGNDYRQGNGFNQNAGGYDTTGDPGVIGILNGSAGLAQKEGSMSFLHWLVILLLPFIPMIGSFAYIILLFVWAFGKTASVTRKNWARATLIMLLVGIFMLSSMISSILGEAGVADLMSQMTGSLQ